VGAIGQRVDLHAHTASGLQRLKRVSWRSVLQVVLLLLAVTVLVRTVTGLDLGEITDGSHRDLVARVVRVRRRAGAPDHQTSSSAPRLCWCARPVTCSSSPRATSACQPTSAARRHERRFFQKQGSARRGAGQWGLDSFSGFLVEATLLLGLLLHPQTLHFDSTRLLAGVADRALVLVVLAVVSASCRCCPIAPAASSGRGTWWRTGGHGVQLGSPRRLVLLLGGNLGSILLFSAALGLFAAALGTTVSFSDLVVITISVSLLAGLLPVPGGIGVVETGLTLGLVAAGMPEGAAFAAVILYRLATFYIPPLWGFPAFRNLERHDLL
jgi:hypothetical protein